MPDADAFLRAVIDNPDDDLPRLVYADWLDEHGDAERAEFIRVQCAMARPPMTKAQFERWFGRSQELLTMHRERWVGPIGELVEFASFRRGFVYRIDLPATAFLAHAQRLWSLAPIGWVRLKDAWEEVENLAVSPHLGSVQMLSLYSNYLNDDDAAVLLKSPFIARLRLLDLGHNRLTAATAETLATCPFLDGLQSLDLNGNPVSSRGVAALAASPYLQQLTQLQLLSCNIGAAGAEALTGGDVFP
ncbi:MAG TPA: TIGR02996 domain-containing protein, partial [Gemmataceae bacterium]